MDYALIFITGFLASLHCVGMCGAIVMAYSTQYIVNNQISVNGQGTGTLMTTAFSSTLGLHLAYNAGRVFAYTVLGVIIGFLGSMLTFIKHAAPYVSAVSGLFMIIAGLFMLNIIPLPSSQFWDKISGLSSKTFGKVIRENSLKSKFTLGMLTPLFPCGILYAMLFKAGATQSLVSGGLTMLLFGSGMVPALVLTGTASSLLSSKVRRIGDKLAAVTIILMGIILVLRGMNIPFLAIFSGGTHHGHGY